MAPLKSPKLPGSLSPTPKSPEATDRKSPPPKELEDVAPEKVGIRGRIRSSISRATSIASSVGGIRAKPTTSSTVRSIAPRDGVDEAAMALSTAASLTKDVADMLNNVPWVGTVSGIVGQILAIREEIQSNSDYRYELVERIKQDWGMVLEELTEISKLPQETKAKHLSDLESNLKLYELELHGALSFLQSCSSNKWLVGSDRGEIKQRLDEIQRKLDQIHDRFMHRSVLGMRRALAVMATKPKGPERLLKPVLPPAPRFLIGRTREKEAAIQALNQDHPGSVILLGFGGMGKTCLAVSILHDDSIKKRYKKRLFVSCEGLTKLDALVSEVGNVLRLPIDLEDATLYDAVLVALAETETVICFDNFETIWEPTESRADIEEFLAHVAEIENLGLVVTMRGAEKPAVSYITWASHEPLAGLANPDACELFKKIAGKWDDFCGKLVEAVDRMPLAVTLLAQLVAEDWESPEEVWKRWSENRTAVVQFGEGKTRLTNLEVSIGISLSSPRVKAVPSAKHLLGVLAMLPDGLRKADDFFKRLQPHIPSITISPAAKVLTQASLAYTAQHLEGLIYLRLLSPIRDYILANKELCPSLETRAKVTKCFMDLLGEGEDYSDRKAWRIVRPEISNLRSLLSEQMASGHITSRLVSSVTCFSNWCWYINILDTDMMDLILSHRIESTSDNEKNNSNDEEEEAEESDSGDEGNDDDDTGPDDDDWAGCYEARGMLHDARSRILLAEADFLKALDLYTKAEDMEGQATAYWRLGDIYMDRNLFDKAETFLKKALELSVKIDFTGGRGDALRSLGELYMSRDQLQEAEEVLKAAFEFYKKDAEPLNQAYCLGELGDLYIRQDRFEESERALTQAIGFWKETRDTVGQANGLTSLGDLYRQLDRFDDAEVAYKQSYELSVESEYVQGQGGAIKGLGDVFLCRDQNDEAERALTEAVTCFKKIEDTLGEANAYVSLGEAYTDRREYSRAEEILKKALELLVGANDTLGESDANWTLGELYSEQKRYAEAETHLLVALERTQRGGDPSGERDLIRSIGDLYLEMERFDEAEKSISKSLEMSRDAKNRSNEGNALHSLGSLHSFRGEHAKAEEMFKLALGQFRVEKQSRLDAKTEGEVLTDLGQLYMSLERWDDAEKCFARAKEIYVTLKYPSGEVELSRHLGEVYLKKKEYEKAGMELGSALSWYSSQLRWTKEKDEVSGLVQELEAARLGKGSS